MWCWRRLLSPLDCKEIKPVSPKGNQSLTFIGRTDAKAEVLILWPPDAKKWHWKRPWYWERLKVEGEEDNRGWDGWMASPTQWTWVWVNSGSWWWTGRPGCCSPLGLKESDKTEWLNNNNNLVDINFIRNVTCIGDSWSQFYQEAPEDSVRIWAEKIWKRSWRVKQMIHLRYLRYLTSSTGNKMEGRECAFKVILLCL